MECIENSMELMYTDVGLHRVKATKNSIFGLVLVLFVCLFFLFHQQSRKVNTMTSYQINLLQWIEKKKGKKKTQRHGYKSFTPRGLGGFSLPLPQPFNGILSWYHAYAGSVQESILCFNYTKQFFLTEVLR